MFNPENVKTIDESPTKRNSTYFKQCNYINLNENVDIRVKRQLDLRDIRVNVSHTVKEFFLNTKNFFYRL